MSYYYLLIVCGESLLSRHVVVCQKPLVAAGGAWFDLGHLSV